MKALKSPPYLVPDHVRLFPDRLELNLVDGVSPFSHVEVKHGVSLLMAYSTESL